MTNIFATTFYVFLDCLAQVLTLLHQSSLRLQPAKCFFGFKEVSYLGHTILAAGVSPDSNKVHAVQQFPRPLDVTAVHSFLGLAGYYRRFVPKFCQLSRPLVKLTCLDQLFQWNPECERAFQQLKECLTTAPVVVMYDPASNLRMHTDAREASLGVALYQVKDKVQRPCLCQQSAKGCRNKVHHYRERVPRGSIWHHQVQVIPVQS